MSMRKNLSCLAVVALLTAASGCTSVRTGANPEVPLWMHRASWSLDVVYKRSIVERSRRDGEPYERGEPELDPAGRRVFVGSSDRGLYAVRAEDGSVLWRFETLGYVQCAPLYDPGEDVVYFGSNDGALYKVAAADGKLLWRFATNAEVAQRPVLSGGTLYAVNANDTVLALNPASGKLIWIQHRTPALAMEVAGYAGPLVWRDTVFTGFSDGNVAAFDARTGGERWTPVDLSAEAEQTLGELPEYLDVDTTPVPGVVGDLPVIYVGSYAGGVFALDADSGGQIWSNPAVAGVADLMMWEEPAHPPRDGEGPEVPARELLIAGSGTTGLWALDPATGREQWRKALPQGGVSAPVAFQGALLVTTTRLGVFLLSPTDGSIIDGVHTGEGVSARPAAYGQRAFVLTNQGELMSLHVTPPGKYPERQTPIL